jgi:hypothetical protein
MPFNRLAPKRRSQIARMGAIALGESGKRHKFTPDEARAAREKGILNKKLREQKEAQEANDNK